MLKRFIDSLGGGGAVAVGGGSIVVGMIGLKLPICSITIIRFSPVSVLTSFISLRGSFSTTRLLSFFPKIQLFILITASTISIA